MERKYTLNELDKVTYYMDIAQFTAGGATIASLLLKNTIAAGFTLLGYFGFKGLGWYYGRKAKKMQETRISDLETTVNHMQGELY